MSAAVIFGMITGMTEQGREMSDNRWAAFSDEELSSLHADGTNPMLDAEIRLELNRRESKKATYRGPGLYRAGERRLEVLGTLGDPKVMGIKCPVVMRDEGDSSGILMLEYLHDFNTVDSSGWRTYEYLGPLVPDKGREA